MNVKGAILALTLLAVAFTAAGADVYVPQAKTSGDKVSVPVAGAVSVSVPTVSSGKISVVQPRDGKSAGTSEAKSNFVPGHSYENPVSINGSKTSVPKTSTTTTTKPASQTTAKPAAKSSTTTTAKPATQTTTKPATQTTTKPATQTTTKPATKPSTTTTPAKPATQPTTTKPATKPSTTTTPAKPATQTTTKPAPQTTTKPATQPTTKPAARPQPAKPATQSSKPAQQQPATQAPKKPVPRPAASSEATNVDARGELLPSHKMPNHFQGTIRTNLHFREGQTTLDLTYLTNAATIDAFKEYVESVGTGAIASILIVSKDSPEGAAKESVKRAEQRAAAVAAYVRKLYPQLTDIISVSPDGESWDLLRAYIARDKNINIDNKIQAVQRLSPGENLFKRKDALKDGGLGNDPKVGDISAYLRKKYFPLIRNTAIYIELKK